MMNILHSGRRGAWPLAILLLLLAVMPSVAAVSWDHNGNSLLSGSWNLRQVVWVTADRAGNLSRKLALSGEIVFNGKGGYTLTGTLADTNTTGSPKPYSFSGTYEIAGSGHGWISSPVTSGAVVRGLVANGVFIASSTEAGYNDLLVAARPPEEAANVKLIGNYRAAWIDFGSLTPSSASTAWLKLAPTGTGVNSGTVAETGYSALAPSTVVSRTLSGVTYGKGNITFPASTAAPALVSGAKTIHLSPDGSLFFGGADDGYDLIIGVRLGESAAAFHGMYYQAGVDADASSLTSGEFSLDTFYGAINTVDNAGDPGRYLGHQRVNAPALADPFDYAYSETYPASGSAEYDDAAGSRFAVGENGLARLGFGKGPYLGLSIALKAQTITGPAPFLHPAGAVNAASSAPFTARVAPGEMMSLYGSGLASTTANAAALPLPVKLGDVEVLVNGTPAPLLMVSPSMVSFLVPQKLDGGIVRFEVRSNGATSNPVTLLTSLASPGVFTNPSGGLGYAAAQRTDYSQLTPDVPAHVGETLSVYLTGLGAISNAPADGAAGPSKPLGIALNQVNVKVDGKEATVSFAGLAPGLAGLYQVNFEVPPGLTSANAALGISGPDFVAVEATLPVVPVTAAPLSSGASARERLMHQLRTQKTSFHQRIAQ